MKESDAMDSTEPYGMKNFRVRKSGDSFYPEEYRKSYGRELTFFELFSFFRRVRWLPVDYYGYYHDMPINFNSLEKAWDYIERRNKRLTSKDEHFYT
jgi:hypothetical protein